MGEATAREDEKTGTRIQNENGTQMIATITKKPDNSRRGKDIGKTNKERTPREPPSLGPRREREMEIRR